jgi:hypothetical protein
MAANNDIVSRAGQGGTNLVPVDYADVILQAAVEQSAAMQLFPHYNMGTYQERIPVLTALPQASFVNGEASALSGSTLGLKSTTNVAWEGRMLTAETIAAIIVVPKQLLADSQFDIFAQVQPKISEAIGRALDASVFFGAVKQPTSYPTPLVPASVGAGLTVTQGTNDAADGGLEQDFADLIALVENQGFQSGGYIANTTLKAAIRGTRTTYGQPVDPANFNPNSIYDEPVTYPLKGLWPTHITGLVASFNDSDEITLTTGNTSQLDVGQAISGTDIPANSVVTDIVDSTHFHINNTTTGGSQTDISLTLTAPVAMTGDWSQGILGVRQDLSYQILTEATLFNDAGAATVALAQSNAIGLLVEARFGFAVANWATYLAPNEATRYPFATMLA